MTSIKWTLCAAALVCGLSACSSDATEAPEKVPVASTTQALVPPPTPNCNGLASMTLYAKPHSSGFGSGYTSPFPNAHLQTRCATGDQNACKIASYEQSVWNIPRADGYEYMVRVAGDPPDASGQYHYYYAIEIRDRWAVPAYLMSPPAGARAPQQQDPFSATDNDYGLEYNLAQPPNTAAPILARQGGVACAYVYADDNHAFLLDFFPAGDVHDPNGEPW
jgi:hypothetical protein